AGGHTIRMTLPVLEHLRSRIHRDGPISFYDFMETVLYHPEFGYYSSPRDPIGREGDFYTSADLDPIFGKLIARKFAQMAAEIAVPPEAFTIVELGAGRGLLARDILTHTRFPYKILERSSMMRARQRKLLAEQEVEWIED